MKIVLTGASGFVGSHLTRALTAAGHRVVALSRRAEESGKEGAEGGGRVIAARGDVTTGAGLADACRDADAVVHLVGIIKERGEATFGRVHVEGTRKMVEAAEAAGVRRFVHMSALGADEASGSRYARTKAQAEGLVRSSRLEWTIFRPSLIFGPGDDFFGGTLRSLVTGYPLVIPQIGRGQFPFRPVWIGDVAAAFVQSLAKADTVGRTFALVGPREYSLAELLERVRDALGSKKPRFPVPLPLMRLAVPAMQILPEPPITQDQFKMLLAGNTADPGEMRAAFALEWRTLEAELPRILGEKAG